MLIYVSLFFGTFVAEDVTAVAAGVLVHQGRVGALAAVLATTAGIVAGDLLLWLAGRLAGDRLFAWPWIARRLSPAHRQSTRDLFNRRAAALMLSSRALPGTRLPLYLAVGAAGGSPARFALWSAVAAALWVPAIVLASAASLWLAAGGFMLLALRASLRRLWQILTARAARSRRCARIVATVSRAWRWEFWPMWLFYPPVALWTVILAVRYKGFGAISAANPGIADGGIVGESKYEILRRLPQDWIVPSWRLAPGDASTRLRQLDHFLRTAGWSYPLVLKPDVGQRGVGMRCVRSADQALAYLADEPGAVLVQPLHEGPYEAGIFYYRKPAWAHGLILSITDKRFPVIVGDGRSTIEDLIWAHPRYRMQAGRFLARHDSVRTRVLAAGEAFILARAGNHAQGTMFVDGAHLITPALESRIDAIARAFPGFFIGRFDVRYRDPEAFKAGRDLAIVELNGATAEATDIYDPSRSLGSAYRTLFRQWRLVFAIGAANRARGAAASSPRRLAALLAAHVASRPAHATSD